MRSWPADPDRRPAAWVTDSDGEVAFLDLPGLDGGSVVREIERALAHLPDDSVVCVYTDDPATEPITAAWAAGRGIEPVTVIAHEAGGVTLVLRATATGVRPWSRRPREPS